MDIEDFHNLKNIEKIEENFRVTKSNVLIDGVYSLSAMEQKVLLLAISLISPEDDDFKVYSVRASAIKEILNVNSNDFYRQLKLLTFNVLSKPFWYQDVQTNREIQAAWFASCEYLDGEGVVIFEFSPKVRHLLLSLQGNFTTYMLKNALKLKSKYAIRLYELMKKGENLKTIYLSVDSLKRMLGLKGQYEKYAHFKSAIIKVAQREINESTDIYFTMSEYKSGRKIDKLKFTIRENTQNISKVKEIDLFDLTETGYKLINYKVARERVIELVKKYDDDYISDKIQQFEFELKIDNEKINTVGMGKYLYNLIIHPEWTNAEYEQVKAQKQHSKRAQERQAQKQKNEKLKEQYEEFVHAQLPKYEELDAKLQKRIDGEVEKLLAKSKQVGFSPEFIVQITRQNAIYEEYKDTFPSFEEWAGER